MWRWRLVQLVHVRGRLVRSGQCPARGVASPLSQARASALRRTRQSHTVPPSDEDRVRSGDLTPGPGGQSVRVSVTVVKSSSCKLPLLYRHVMAKCSVKLSPHGDLHDEQEGSTPSGPGARRPLVSTGGEERPLSRERDAFRPAGGGKETGMKKVAVGFRRSPHTRGMW